MGKQARLKGVRKLKRAAILAGVTDEEKGLLRDYHEQMYAIPGKPYGVIHDEAFYVSTLLDMRECWAELEERGNVEHPSIKQMLQDISVEYDAPVTFSFPDLESPEEALIRRAYGNIAPSLEAE